MTEGRQGVFGSTNIINPIKVIFYFQVKWQQQVDASKKLSFLERSKTYSRKTTTMSPKKFNEQH